jgi:hypothetical protein
MQLTKQWAINKDLWIFSRKLLNFLDLKTLYQFQVSEKPSHLQTNNPQNPNNQSLNNNQPSNKSQQPNLNST